MDWIGRSRTVCVFLLTALLIAGCESPIDIGIRVFGYVDTRGKVVIAPTYEDARPFHEGRAAVKGRRGWGYIDAAGHWAVKPIYQRAESFSDGRARVSDSSGMWGYVDRAGTAVIAPQFACESPFFGAHAFVQPSQGPVRLIDENGRTLRTMVDITLRDCDLDSEQSEGEYRDVPTAWKSIGAEWEESWLAALREERLYAAYAGESVANEPSSRKEVPAKTQNAGTEGKLPEVVAVSGKIGYLDPLGNWAVPPVRAQDAGPFVDGLARIKRADKVGFIDQRGRVVVPFRFDDALRRFSHDRTVALREGHAWLIDRTGKSVADLGRWPWPDLGDNEHSISFSILSSYVGLSWVKGRLTQGVIRPPQPDAPGNVLGVRSEIVPQCFLRLPHTRFIEQPPDEGYPCILCKLREPRRCARARGRLVRHIQARRPLQEHSVPGIIKHHVEALQNSGTDACGQRACTEGAGLLQGQPGDDPADANPSQGELGHSHELAFHGAAQPVTGNRDDSRSEHPVRKPVGLRVSAPQSAGSAGSGGVRAVLGDDAIQDTDAAGSLHQTGTRAHAFALQRSSRMGGGLRHH